MMWHIFSMATEIIVTQIEIKIWKPLKSIDDDDDDSDDDDDNNDDDNNDDDDDGGGDGDDGGDGYDDDGVSALDNTHNTWLWYWSCPGKAKVYF